MRAFVGRHTNQLTAGSALAGLGNQPPAANIETPHFKAGVLPNVGPGGPAILHAFAQRCESDYVNLGALFGLPGPSFNVTIAGLSTSLNGSGGAYHPSCDDPNITADACVAPVLKPFVTCALVVAEMVEVYSALQDGGWDCGSTNGEGLSRVIAAVEYPGVLDSYETASAWLDSFRPDYVNVNAQTDLDPISNGCSVLFLNYLRYQLGFSWQHICQNPGNNLAGTYAKLTGRSDDPFVAFSALLAHRFPEGQASMVKNDNPFPI